MPLVTLAGVNRTGVYDFGKQWCCVLSSSNLQQACKWWGAFEGLPSKYGWHLLNVFFGGQLTVPGLLTPQKVLIFSYAYQIQDTHWWQLSHFTLESLQNCRIVVSTHLPRALFVNACSHKKFPACPKNIPAGSGQRPVSSNILFSQWPQMGLEYNSTFHNWDI